MQMPLAHLRAFSRRFLLAAALPTLALLAMPSLWAVDRTWSNTGTDYNNGSSWGGTAPGTGDAAVFNTAAGTQPTLSADITNQQLRFSVAGASGYTLGAAPGTALTLTSVGTGATAGTGSALVAAHTSGVNTLNAPIVLGAAAGSTQSIRLAAGGTTFVVGNISEANSGILLRVESSSTTSGILNLSGSNSFTGGLLLTGGILEIGSDTAMPGVGTIALANGIMRSADNTPRTFANPVDLSGSVAFGGDTLGQQGTLLFTGDAVLSNHWTAAVVGVSPAPVSAAVFTGDIGETNGSRTLTVGGRTNGTGRGYLFLLGDNTYTGQTTINNVGAAGPVVVNRLGVAGETSSSLGAPTGADRTIGIAVGNSSSSQGYLRYVGPATTTDRPLSFGHSAANNNANNAILDASGSGALNWTGNMTVNGADGQSGARNLTFTGTSPAANTFAGNIPNPAAGTGLTTLSKTGTGSWTLAGANTFTGGLTVASGRLVLDYATGQVLPNSPSNTLVMGGGMLELRGAASGATAQTFGNLTATNGTGLSTIKVVENGGAGTTLAVGTVAVNTSSTNLLGPSDVLFDLHGSPASGVTIANAIDATPGSSSVNGHFLIRTVAGQYDFLHNGNNPANPIAAVNAATILGPTNGSASTDYLFSNTGTIGLGSPTTAVAARSLRIAPTLDNQTMTIANINADPASGAGVIVAGSGIVFDLGAYDFTVSGGSDPTRFAVIRTSNGGINVFSIHHFGTGKLTFDNTVYLGRSGQDALAFNGTGLVDWQGGTNSTESSNRATFLIHGTTLRISGTTDAVRLDNATSGKGSAKIGLNGGGVLEAVHGDITRNLGAVAGGVVWYGDGGFSAFGGDRAVRLNDGTGTLAWGATSFVAANNALVLSSNYSDSLIDFQNGLHFGYQQRVVRVNDGSAAVDARLSGVLAGGYGGGLIKEGTGTLELTGANDYLGETWVRAGTLLINGDQSAALGAITVDAGATLGGSGSAGGNTVIAGLHSPGNSAGIQTFNANLAYVAGAAVLWELTANTTVNAANPNALFDTVVVLGDLDFAGLTTLTLKFDAAGSGVLWSAPLWQAPITGTEGWLLYDVAGNTTTFDNLILATANWQDSDGDFFATALPKGYFSLYQDGSHIYLNYALIPEPASLTLLLAGGLLALRRQRGAKGR